MENSCRKKYKPSSKKWILASSYPEFRRNSALIPANAGLYHYAGNCPVRYIDPDGRETFEITHCIPGFNFERKFVQQVLGEIGTWIYDNAIIWPLAVDGRSGSFPLMNIAYDPKVAANPILEDKNTFIHEIYHQIQYLTIPNAFFTLIDEFELNEQMAKYGNLIGYEAGQSANNILGCTLIKPVYDGKTVINYTYQYDKSLKNYTSLKDLPFLESQAQFVGDYAEEYYKARYGEGLNAEASALLKRRAEIMSNSGYKYTEAVKWILNEL